MMFKRAALALLMLPSLAFAWGGQGHQVVALIAEARLTPAAQDGIHELLGPDVDISDAEIASWADQIKRERRATADWHYVNIPITSAGFDRKRDGHNRENVIDKIDDQSTILADRSKSPDERAEALKWVVHLVGDLEQPLHCADRDKDRGGNAQLCWMPGSTAKKATNLHTVWDTAILTKMIGRARIAEFSADLDAKITEKDAQAWAAGSPVDWANESMRVAATKVYPGVEAGTCPTLPRTYVDAAKPVIEQQLERGGVRLATVLNRAFASGPTSPPAPR
jgi:hypothetical protein